MLSLSKVVCLLGKMQTITAYCYYLLKPAGKEIRNCQSLRKWWRVCHYLNSQTDHRWKLVKTTATGIRNLAIFCNIFRYSWTCSMNIKPRFEVQIYTTSISAIFQSGILFRIQKKKWWTEKILLTEQKWRTLHHIEEDQEGHQMK